LTFLQLSIGEFKFTYHHHSFLAKLISVWLFFFQIPNVFKHLRQLPLECSAPEIAPFCAFLA